MNTWSPLKLGAVYQWNQQLLEVAAEGDTWRLYLLTEDGEYITEAQGRLMGYELRPDCSGWDMLFYAQIAPLWPKWSFLRGAAIVIDPASLDVYAESRAVLQAADEEEKETFSEIMAEFLWEQ